ncbi:putative oxidoreductase C-terminal domain-containing protein [Limibacterium fermenti]|uniref:putative oxidoreductase C-terminal domain-containing protein n=1 Tax=Limibacterium fermenti TaxID=3229863 RepID=UPI003A7AAA29
MKCISNVVIASIFLLFAGCGSGAKKESAVNGALGKDGEIKLMVLAPGHFHASLLQKNDLSLLNDSTIALISDSVYVYAPLGAELEQYLANIDQYNHRSENPTQWKERVYTGTDFLEKMLADKKGNVVVLAGNNRDKTRYIFESVKAGIHVLSDKPMAVNKENFHLLEQAYDSARAHHVLIYDMMTERYDALNIIERKLLHHQELFGKLETGTSDNPAIYMESVHHFYKEVSGNPLIRPAWYYDVEQQGEGIADVTTHLIDLVNWKCFPEQVINYLKDVDVVDATHWPTELSLADFARSTGMDAFPDYLGKYIKDSKLQVYANGTIHYRVKDVNVALKVVWNYQAPQGGGDTFTAYIKGSRATLKTVQDKSHQFIKQLYIEKGNKTDAVAFETALNQAMTEIQNDYPQVSAKAVSGKEGVYLIDIPVEIREPHEAHFGYVGKQFFNYLIGQDLPEWENSNTLAKYFITTTAVEKAKENK